MIIILIPSITVEKNCSLYYILTISDQFKTIAEKNNFKIAYKPINNLSHFIKLGKDRLEKMEQCDVVYKISCLNCDSSYVGQTKRKIKNRNQRT